CLGMSDWRADADLAISISTPLDAISYVVAIMWKYVLAIPFGALAADMTAVEDTAKALRIAEQTGDDFILGLARLTHGFTQLHQGGSNRDYGMTLLTQVWEGVRN